jgi:hypothetical protein
MRRLAIDYKSWVDDDQFLDDKYVHIETSLWLGDVRTKKNETHYYRRTMPLDQYLDHCAIVDDEAYLAIERRWMHEHWFTSFRVGEYVHTPWLAHDMPQYGRVIEIEKHIARVEFIPIGNPPGRFAFRFALTTVRPEAYGKQN